jgi:hypothetical protein
VVVELGLRTAGLGASIIRKSSAVVIPIEDVSEPAFLDLDPSSIDEDRVRGSREGCGFNNAWAREDVDGSLLDVFGGTSRRTSCDCLGCSLGPFGAMRVLDQIRYMAPIV